MKKIDYIEILSKLGFDCSRFVYKDLNTKSTLVCSEHGEFRISIRSIQRGGGCSGCSEKIKTTEKFIQKSVAVFGQKYDYSKTKYTSSRKPVLVNCSEHGNFRLLPAQHLRGQGCALCSQYERGLEFIEFSKSIHSGISYDRVAYKNNKTPVILVCHDHGEFSVRPDNHIVNRNGCPSCKLSKGELAISKFLERLGIVYEIQKKFKDCKIKTHLRFDFYIPAHNTCIEFNGIQHYESVAFFGGYKTLEYNKERDRVKMEFCKKSGIKLIIIKVGDNIENILNFYFGKYIT